jgi:SAM-dependent methyltransferase
MNVWIRKAVNPGSRPLDYMEYAFHLMGDLKGKEVLDVGSGGGWISRLLALKGASMTAFDISIEGCISTRRKLGEVGARCDSLAVMDTHHMAFKNSSFDAIFTNGTLYHLNIGKVAPKLYRILKSGGRLVYCEPLKYGVFMRALKTVWLNAHGMEDRRETEHEEGLRMSDFAPFASAFPKGFIRRFNFVAKTARLRKRFGPLANTLRWADYVLLSAAPPLRRYCTCAVGCFEK